MKKQSGFTLVELVVVIAIIGIMAAVAVPRFIDLKDDARKGALDSLAGALGAAATTNFAARQVNTTKGVAVTTCAGFGALLQGGAMPTPSAGSYAISGAFPNAAASGDTTTCTVTHSGTGVTQQTATFNGIYTP